VLIHDGDRTVEHERVGLSENAIEEGQHLGIRVGATAKEDDARPVRLEQGEDEERRARRQLDSPQARRRTGVVPVEVGRVLLVGLRPEQRESQRGLAHPPKAMRLKLEINSREHFTEHGHVSRRFEVRSRWWSGSADITTFSLEELLGTKLRALYQRKKGRDLFDLWYAIEKGADPAGIVACFTRYMRESAVDVSRAEFEQNLAAKLEDEIFAADMAPLLRQGIAWDVAQAGQVVMSQLLARLPGAPWRRPPREH